ncbi:preprotein translocase, SecG subunit [Umbribacter vaginalis]|nr:preprotein translocase, SecG subunit [Coriobacteriales bacterium DNF00809]
MKAVNPLLIILLVLLVVSGLGLIVFILLHSGKGTGVSDMIASSVYSSQSGTSIVEKNLDRITIVLAIIFMLSLIALMLIYPQGTINS